MQPTESPAVAPASMPRRVKLRAALPLLALLFAATGFAGLLSEQSYEKLLSSLLGASTPAAALVLAAYFGGLALGASLYGRLASGRRAPLRAYARLELGVTLWSLLLAVGASGLTALFAPLLRLGLGSFEALQALRLLVACLWVVPPTVAMGATFPAVVDALEALRAPQPRRMMSRFYALNLAGAAAGALAGPYLVFPALGLRGTLLVCALVDALAALAALWLLRRLRPRQAWAQARKEPARPVTDSLPKAAANTPSLPLLLFAVAAGSGFLSFGLEVVWTHLIAAVLGNSIYAFAAMLALVLLGLLAGSLLATRLFGDDRPVPAAIPGALLVAASALLLLQRAHWPEVPAFFVAHGAEVDGFFAGERLRWFQAALQLFPVCAVLGAVYPLLFRLDLFPAAGRAAAVARLSALNSVGCVLGALVTGFWLIPTLGSEATLLALGVGALLAGALLVLASVRRSTGPTTLGASVLHSVPLVSALGLVYLWSVQPAWDLLKLTSGGHVYFSLLHVDETSSLKWFHEDTHGGITTVVEAPSSGSGGVTRTLLTNGKFQANDSGETRAQTGIAVVPMLHVREAGRALVIGLGSGASAGQIAAAGFQTIDIAEIAPGMVLAARDWFGHVNREVMKDPRVQLHLEDGRNFLLLHQDLRYHLISLEISSLWYAGSTSLYSREFYRLAQSRLAPGGVLQQWVQLHHISVEEIGSVVLTLRETFKHVALWVVGGQGILVASDGALAIQAMPLMQVIGPEAEENPEQVEELSRLLASRLLSEADVDRMLAARPFHLNTDANRWLEYATPRYNLVKRDLYTENLNSLAQWSSFSAPALGEHVRPLVHQLVEEATVEMKKEALGLE